MEISLVRVKKRNAVKGRVLMSTTNRNPAWKRSSHQRYRRISPSVNLISTRLTGGPRIGMRMYGILFPKILISAGYPAGILLAARELDPLLLSYLVPQQAYPEKPTLNTVRAYPHLSPIPSFSEGEECLSSTMRIFPMW